LQFEIDSAINSLIIIACLITEESMIWRARNFRDRELEDSAQDPNQPEPSNHTGQGRPDTDHRWLTSGWKRLTDP